MEKLTKKEKKELRKAEWQQELEKERKNQIYKKIGLWLGIALFIIATIGIIYLFTTPSSSNQQSSITVRKIDSGDITIGKKDAKITLIEYSDFQCPACAAFHPVTNEIINQYKDRILFAYRFFPLTNIHKNGLVSAKAAYAANLQGKFWEMADKLFTSQSEWSSLDDPKPLFKEYAKSIGLDLAKFTKDIDSEETAKFVSGQQQEGLSAGISYTPSFVLNGKLINTPSSIDGFKKLIDDELNKK